MKTKKQHLLSHLKRGWLTPLQAVERVGIFSLSQRCGEFRRDGINVIDKWVSLPSGARVKAYTVARG